MERPKKPRKRRVLTIAKPSTKLQRSRPGPKPMKFDAAKVEEMAGIGMSEAAICEELGVSEETLRRHRRGDSELGAAIKKGRRTARAFVSRQLWALIEKKHLGAIVWWEKTRGGITDGVEIKLPRLVPETKQSLLLAFTTQKKKADDDE